MNPHIVLKIENFIPHIYYRHQDGTSKKITHQDDNILENMTRAATKLKLNFNSDLKGAALYLELITLAREADEFYMDVFVDLDPDNIEFGVNSLFEKQLENAANIAPEYNDIPMKQEAREEIDQNQRKDLFASILESLYLRLIAKTLLAAADLGIGEVHLDDESKNARLAERMSKELEKMGAELIID